MERYDAVVVGSGPNGLSAAVTVAQAGRSVLVVEAADQIGGGTRTLELTKPGFRHDVCSAIHPFAAGSPYFRTLPLTDHGLEWIHPDLPLAHLLGPESVAVLEHDLGRTISRLGSDGPAYRAVMEPTMRRWAEIESHIFGPLLRVPRHPVPMARFGINALAPATLTARSRFRTQEAAALFAGCAAHAFLPLERPFTASFGWLLMAGAHLYGWPLARGGSQAIAEALASLLRSLGGEIVTGRTVTSLDELPASRTILLDVTPDVFATIARDRLPTGYLRRTGQYRRGPGVFKLDAALDEPIPWIHPDLPRAGTIHIGGTAEEVAEAERMAWQGRVTTRPFVLVAQQSLFDSTRAPQGKHTLWAYAHVPQGSDADYTDVIIDRIEEFAPGLRDRILSLHVHSPADLERSNPNYVGGDITGGAHTLRQLVFRPFPQRDPYATPIDGVFLCSSATPPGAGTHGMCGHNAALRALSWTDR